MTIRCICKSGFVISLYHTVLSLSTPHMQSTPHSIWNQNIHIFIFRSIHRRLVNLIDSANINALKSIIYFTCPFEYYFWFSWLFDSNPVSSFMISSCKYLKFKKNIFDFTIRSIYQYQYFNTVRFYKYCLPFLLSQKGLPCNRCLCFPQELWHILGQKRFVGTCLQSLANLQKEYRFISVYAR